MTVPVMKQVTCQGLAHQFPGTGWLFTGLDVTLSPGEVVAVVGPSGSGKSTLLSVLAGWLEPNLGSVTRAGVEHTGWVFQNPVGVAGRSALDHVVLPLLTRGWPRGRAVPEALGIMGRFGLDEVAGRRFRELSGGEAQRLMLARAVAASNDLLLVDEPTAQLDMATAASVNRVLANVAQDDVMVVVATHDPHTRDACTRVIDLADYQGGNLNVGCTAGVSAAAAEAGDSAPPGVATGPELLPSARRLLPVPHPLAASWLPPSQAGRGVS